MAKTGDILVQEGLISRAGVDQGLAIQEKNRTAPNQNRDQLFGMVLCDMNLVTPLDTYHALDKHEKLISVADFLVQKNILTRAAMERAAQKAQADGVPLISHLADAKIVSRPLLRQVLFDLFHIPFRSVSDIVFDKRSREVLTGIIPAADASAHKVIPIQLQGHTLVAGITSPENLGFLKEVDQRFPLYRISPVFISFSGFTWFYKLLYQEPRPPGQRADGSRPPLTLRVTDPERDKKAVLAFYDRYEHIRKKRGLNSDSGQSRAALFLEFIRTHHDQICRRCNCTGVEFSLHREPDGRLTLLARPEKEKPWQE